MKNNILLLIIGIFFLASCSKEGDDYNNGYRENDPVYSQTGTPLFSKIFFILKPYKLDINGDKQYIISDSLSEINVMVDGETWGKAVSMPLNKAAFLIDTLDGLLISKEKTSYAVISTYLPLSKKLTTAGEYSDLLENGTSGVNTYGNHFFQIDSLKINTVNGLQSFPIQMQPHYFKVEKPQTDIYLTEFEILIK